MSAPDIIADLQNRVNALEQKAGVPSEALQPSYLTINPANGLVSATFSGHVKAQGIDLTEAPSNTTQDAVDWLDGGGTVREYIQGFASVGGGHALFLSASPSVGQCFLRLNAGGTVPAIDVSSSGVGRRIIDPNGFSDFLQLASTQKLQLNIGTAGSLASGAQETVNHGLGTTPQIVLVTNSWADNTSSAFYTVFGQGATQFTIINKGSTTGIPMWAALG